jgi:predicted dehydrogenase
MKNKIRWGILSTAKIARVHIIPALQQSRFCEVAAIASRDGEKAAQTAQELAIPTFYSNYEDLLADPDIDAIYNPLPNNLHLEYTIKALQAGKHVLCEKPIGLNAVQAQQLLDAALQHPHLKVMEAFMYRFHPQWQKARAIVDEGLLGEVKTIHSFFSYFNIDAANIRNKPEAGGGALMDIGCYCVSFPRFIFDSEPLEAVSLIDRDPIMQIDRITSAMLNFGSGKSALFTCATQLEPYQRVHIVGTKGKLEIEIPVNAPADAPAKMWLQVNKNISEVTTPAANQYTLQCDAFSAAILNDTPVPTPLTDAICNMKIIDTIVKSAEEKAWTNC